MKRVRQLLKWTGIIVLVFIAGISILSASRQNLTFEAPYPAIKASKDSAIIARGKHLATTVAHCTDCHHKGNADSLLNLGEDVPLSGGVAFDLPVGTIYSANISSDTAYGIGKYTDAEIARALRYGIHPDGTAVYDFMPFHNLSDDDLTAILSYLRTQKPVAVKKPDNNLNLVGNLVKAFLVEPVGPNEKIETAVKEDSSAAYGKYLVLNVGNCGGCHTQRSLSGSYTGPFMAGGNPMKDGICPPNLTTDSSSRIFGWSQQNFIDRFHMGKIIPATEMPWNSFKRMNNTELKAIYNFLQTVKPAKTPAAK